MGHTKTILKTKTKMKCHLYGQVEVGKVQQLTVVVLGCRPDEEVELGQTLDLRVRPVEVGVGQRQLDLLSRVVRIKRRVQLLNTS